LKTRWTSKVKSQKVCIILSIILPAPIIVYLFTCLFVHLFICNLIWKTRWTSKVKSQKVLFKVGTLGTYNIISEEILKPTLHK